MISLALDARMRAWPRRTRPGGGLSAPVLLVPPALAGPGRVGAEIAVDPGRWQAVPAPGFTYQWRRDGADIPGAAAAGFRPGAADDGRSLDCRVTAANAAGAAAALSDSLVIVHAPPELPGALADLTFFQNTGVQTVDVSSGFSGAALTFRVEGEGVAIDPATGALSIATDRLVDGITVTVTASNSGGEAVGRFRLDVVSEPVVGPAETAPAVVAAPSLAGSGRIGAPVSLDTGTWAGHPVPALTIQWLRDGAEIVGATDPAYVPGDEDDLTELSARVTASNAAGAASAGTAALAITRVPPVAAGGLADVRVTQGSGPQAVETAGDFTGDGLAFAVAGGGALIDADSGRITLPTGALRADETVTVTAANSGGAATSSFRVSVTAALLPPQAVGTLPDVAYVLGGGGQSVSAQAAFSGADLVYSLDAAPAGVTIHAGSGLVSIPTDAALAATITVRAANAAGSAIQSFQVTVAAAGPVATDFTLAAALGEVSHLAQAGAPAWTHEADGFARLVPAAASRSHGAWSKAAGDGLYRCLARWSTTNWGEAGIQPFVFGLGITRSGSNFSGAFISLGRPTLGAKYIQCHEYSGTGTVAVERAAARPLWRFNAWNWVEVEVDGASVRARVYEEVETAPDWQIVTTLAAAPGAGAFGPGSLPWNGVSPVVEIRRLELAGAGAPVAATPPAAPLAGDWTLDQTTGGQ